MLAACESYDCGDVTTSSGGACPEECPSARSMSNTPSELVSVGDRVYFVFGKDAYGDGQTKFGQNSTMNQETVSRMADWLKKNECTRVVIQGRTDNRGTVDFNLGLGARRAEALKKALIAHGVPQERLNTISFGKSDPIIPNASTECEHAQNRVAVVVTE
eukprot:g8549.t1